MMSRRMNAAEAAAFASRDSQSESFSPMGHSQSQNLERQCNSGGQECTPLQTVNVGNMVAAPMMNWTDHPVSSLRGNVPFRVHRDVDSHEGMPSLSRPADRGRDSSMHNQSVNSVIQTQQNLGVLNTLMDDVSTIKQKLNRSEQLEEENQRLKLELQQLSTQKQRSSNRYQNLAASKLVKNIAKLLPDDQKFKGEELKNSPHNSKVIGDLRKRALEQNAMMGPTQKMSITDIELAISREFINCKRRGKVITPEEKAKRNNISRKQHTRTWRSSGMKYLTDEEREMWSRVTNDLLSDEELDEDTKTITSRAPRWRSNRLNNIIRKLDEKTSMLRDPKYKRLRGPFSDRPKPRDTERNYGLLNQ